MSFTKVLKDRAVRFVLGNNVVPRGLVELHQYFHQHGPISFQVHQEDGLLVAVSSDFRYGSIVTSGANQDVLDKNIKDAILTSFEIPSSFAPEAQLMKIGDVTPQYALA